MPASSPTRGQGFRQGHAQGRGAGAAATEGPGGTWVRGCGRASRAPRWWGLVGLVLGLFWVCGAWAGPKLLVSGPGSSLRLPLPVQGFTLAWEHSVERTQWRETFVVDSRGNLVLSSSEFSSAGAGLPDRLEEGDVFVLRDGRMTLTNHRVVMPELRILLSGISHHFLSVDGQLLDLNAIFGEGVVIIRAATSHKEGMDEKN